MKGLRMDLKEEIALLERKLELLKLIKQAQDQIGQPQPVYVPYPVYPEPYYPTWPYPVTTSGTTYRPDGTQFTWTN